MLCKMIRAERQLAPAIAGPCNESNSHRQCDRVGQAEIAQPRVEQPAHPTDDRQQYAAPHMLGNQPSGIPATASQAPSQKRRARCTKSCQRKNEASRETQICEPGASTNEFQYRYQQKKC